MKHRCPITKTYSPFLSLDKVLLAPWASWLMPGAQTHRLVAYTTDLSLSHKVFWVAQGSGFSIDTGPSLAC